MTRSSRSASRYLKLHRSLNAAKNPKQYAKRKRKLARFKWKD
jgi:hypothetical protein